ncbi:MAG: aldehyde dehydrogenase family protein, partial [Hyphomicrobiales bacterium]
MRPGRPWPCIWKRPNARSSPASAPRARPSTRVTRRVPAASFRSVASRNHDRWRVHSPGAGGLRSHMSETLKNYIDGAWRESSDRATFPNEDPARRGSELNRAAASTEADIDAAVGAAACAFAAWGRTALPERQAAVERFLDALASEREALARVVSQENGKTIREARGEV